MVGIPAERTILGPRQVQGEESERAEKNLRGLLFNKSKTAEENEPDSNRCRQHQEKNLSRLAFSKIIKKSNLIVPALRHTPVSVSTSRSIFPARVRFDVAKRRIGDGSSRPTLSFYVGSPHCGGAIVLCRYLL